MVPDPESDRVFVRDPAAVSTGDVVASQESTTGKRRWRRLVIASAIGLGVVALAQYLAPATDHQLANIATAIAGGLTLLFVLFQSFLEFHYSIHLLALLSYPTICSLQKIFHFHCLMLLLILLLLFYPNLYL